MEHLPSKTIYTAQSLDKFVTVCRLCRRHDLLLGSVHVAYTDIVKNSVVEQGHILKYKGHTAHQVFRFNGANIHTTNGNLTFSYIPKAGNEFGNCAFAAAGRPYQGRYAASRNRKRHILDNIVLVISESDIFQFNVILGYILIRALHSGRGQQGTHTRPPSWGY
jgi:hypothetical protein